MVTWRVEEGRERKVIKEHEVNMGCPPFLNIMKMKVKAYISYQLIITKRTGCGDIIAHGSQLVESVGSDND